jgi:hypothetical protein
MQKLNSATNLKRKFMICKISRCGWLPNLPDHRDYLYSAPAEIVGALPYSYLISANLASDFWTIRVVA